MLLTVRSFIRYSSVRFLPMEIMNIVRLLVNPVSGRAVLMKPRVEATVKTWNLGLSNLTVIVGRLFQILMWTSTMLLNWRNGRWHATYHVRRAPTRILNVTSGGRYRIATRVCCKKLSRSEASHDVDPHFGVYYCINVTGSRSVGC